MTFSSEIAAVTAAVLAAAVMAWFLLKRGSFRKRRAEPSVIRGFAGFFSGDDERTLSELRELAAKDGATPETVLAIAFLYRKAGDFTRAAHIHETILASDGISRELEALVRTELARDYLSADMPLKALSALKNGDVPDKTAENLEILARASLEAGDYDGAAYWHARYKKAGGRGMAGFYCECMMGKAAVSNGSAGVWKAISAALKENPSCRPARFAKAAVYSGEGRHTKALSEYKSVLAGGLVRDEKDVKAVSDAFLAAGEETEYVKILKNMASRGEGGPLERAALADYYEESGDKEAAAAVLETYLEETGELSVTAAKKYAELKKDRILAKALAGEKPFVCLECGSPSGEYRDECPACRSFDRMSAR